MLRRAVLLKGDNASPPRLFLRQQQASTPFLHPLFDSDDGVASFAAISLFRRGLNSSMFLPFAVTKARNGPQKIP